MSLLDLSTELLQMIIEETRPEAFESFVLTCNGVMKPQDHALRNTIGRANPFDVLLAIMRKPLVAEYIQEISFEDMRWWFFIHCYDMFLIHLGMHGSC